MLDRVLNAPLSYFIIEFETPFVLSARKGHELKLLQNSKKGSSLNEAK